MSLNKIKISIKCDLRANIRLRGASGFKKKRCSTIYHLSTFIPEQAKGLNSHFLPSHHRRHYFSRNGYDSLVISLRCLFFFFFRAEASGKLHRMRAVAFTRLTFCKVTSDDIFHATVHSAGLEALDLSLFCIFFPRCKDGVNAVSGQITSNARPLSSSWDRKARQLLKRQLLAMREGGRS